MKSLSILGILTGILAPVGVGLASVSPVVTLSAPLQISLEFPPAAPNRGGPESTASGGTRGKICISDGTQLMPLVPTQETLTASANPTFFVYIPETQEQNGYFVLKNQRGRDVYSSQIKLPSQPSIIEISLPETVSLPVNQQYKWKFFLTCMVDDQELENAVEVKIMRTELSPDLETKIEQAKDPLEKAKLYASQEIWQDTLMIMADLRASKQKEWEQLLTSVGLGNLATVPFAETLVPTAQNPEPK